ncbi:MAG: DUF1059 domain-containing protein [Candidatus Bathyarchaeia archaeon]
MGRMLECDCGAVIRGNTDDEVMGNAGKHVKEVHPDMNVTQEVAVQLRAKIKDA